MRLPLTLFVYIGRVFLVTIILVSLGFLAIIYLGDLTELMRRAASREGLAFTTVAEMALYKLPGTTEVVLPFAVLIGSMIAFHRLGRHNELSVMRAAGVSVWQFVAPACAAALLFGIFATAVYNPISAKTIASYHSLEATHLLGRQEGRVGNVGASVWLRQSNTVGTAVINAAHGLQRGTELQDVVVYQFDRADRFISRMKAERALYEPGRWRLEQAWVVDRNGEPEFHSAFWVETSMTRTQVSESLGSAKSISFWDLPEFIEIAKRAGLTAHEYRMQYHLLLARPALFVAIALLAAVFSLHPPRSGQVLRLAAAGPMLALVLFVAIHVSKSLGDSGSVPAFVAAWWTVAVGALFSLTVLFFREDG